jgi:hypothetical protein
MKHTSFYNTLYDVDLSVRDLKDINDYQIKIQDSVSEFNDDQKNKLVTAIQIANQKISNIHIEGFDGEKASRMNWNIGCIKGISYENGLPHTVKKTIILPSHLVSSSSLHELVRLLIHEQVHVYQKTYPKDIDSYLSSNQISKYKKREPSDRIRANPDIDEWVYQNEKGVYKLQYIDQPRLITDTFSNDQRREHPFEEMAIRISEL